VLCRLSEQKGRRPAPGAHRTPLYSPAATVFPKSSSTVAVPALWGTVPHVTHLKATCQVEHAAWPDLGLEPPCFGGRGPVSDYKLSESYSLFSARAATSLRHSRVSRTSKTGQSHEARYACACGRGTPGRRLLGTASRCRTDTVRNCQHRPHDRCCDNHRRGQVPDRCVPCSVRFNLPVRYTRGSLSLATRSCTCSASNSLLLSSYGCLVCADGSYIGTRSEAGRLRQGTLRRARRQYSSLEP